MLEEFYNEEINDGEKYRKYADEIEDTHPEFAGIFRDIAHEESTHANLIREMMKKGS